MKIARLVTIIFGSLGSVAFGATLFGLTPGFYSTGDPGLDLLEHYRNKASVQIYLSWDTGISLGDETDITLEQLRGAVKKTKVRALASVLLHKNYTNKSLHLRVEELLIEEGFDAVLTTGAHSSGAYLERYTIKAEQAATGKGLQPSPAL